MYIVELNKLVLKFFNKTLKTNEPLKNFYKVNEKSALSGIFVPKELSTRSVFEFFSEQEVKYNKSFYQYWNDIISKSRLELAVDQILHYMSTYGSDFNGTPYIPNENFNNEDIQMFKELKVLESITMEDVEKSLLELIYANVAYSKSMLEDLFSFVNLLKDDIDIDISKVKNRELQIRLLDLCITMKKPIFLTDPEMIVRYLVLKTTASSLVIKNKETFRKISKSNLDISFLPNFIDLKILSTVFFRYKPIFLAIKKANKNNTQIINKLRKLATNNHIPYKFSYFEKLLSMDEIDTDILMKNLNYISNFKKASLLRAIKIKQNSDNTNSVYNIRNGKIFSKEKNKSIISKQEQDFYDTIYTIIYEHLINSLSEKSCAIKFPEDIELAYPTSEKNFVGDCPFGSYLKFSDKNVIVGVYWEEKSGIRDLDLSGCTKQSKYGWDRDYYSDDSGSCVYSGDVTSSENGANEYLYIKDTADDMIIYINLFSRTKEQSSSLEFDLFVSKELIDLQVSKQLIDPDKILLRQKIKFEDDTLQKILGFVTKGKFVFSNFVAGDKKVSTRNKHFEDIFSFVKKNLNCYNNLKEILLKAGFTFTDNDYKYDLSNKIDLINLLK